MLRVFMSLAIVAASVISGYLIHVISYLMMPFILFAIGFQATQEALRALSLAVGFIAFAGFAIFAWPRSFAAIWTK